LSGAPSAGVGWRTAILRPTDTHAERIRHCRRRITEAGTPLWGSTSTNLLAGLFCVPPTQTFLDQFAQINEPGAVSTTGSLDLSSILTLPLP